MKKLIVTIIMLMALINVAYAAEQVVINSAKWDDVYSGMIFANLKGNDGFFLTSKEYSTFIHKTLAKEPITLIESEKNSLVADFETTLESKDFDVIETIKADNLNLELAKRLNTRKYVIVDSSYGYDAVSAAPYALLTNAYVLLANRNTQNSILGFLDENTPESLLVYGSVSKSFRDQLSKYEPEIIDKASKFSNNMEIVRKFLEKQETSQVTLANGQFLEKGLFNSQFPTLFIGLKQTPEEVIQFAKDNNIKTAVVVGNNLITSGRDFKTKAGLDSVLVKYAQGVPSEEAFAQVVALDMFFVPEPEMILEIEDLTYNTASKSLEVQYKNLGARAYFKSSISVYSEGVLKETVGDREPQLIEAAETTGRSYNVDLTELLSTELKATLFAEFGPEKSSLENTLSKDFTSIKTTDVEDTTSVELISLEYNKKNKELVVNVKNTGTADAYVKAEVGVTSLNIYGEEEEIIFRKKEATLVEKQSEGKVILKAVLDPSTITKTSVKLFYGSRENLLIKSASFSGVSLKQVSGISGTTLVIVLLVVVIVGLVTITLVMRKKRK